MDNRNLFVTPVVYRLLRLEYAAFLIVALIFGYLNLAEIRWWAFIVLFAVIDVIGYIPGAVAYRVQHGRISKIFYVLYNTMHSFATGLIIFALWGYLVRWEWALLAIPIHLCGDRALFGNFLKPFQVSFEPVAHPAYLSFRENYASTARVDGDGK